MSSAIVANDFNTSAIFVRHSFDSTRNFIIKSGPATTGVEFIFAHVQWSVTSLAGIDPFIKDFVIFTRKRLFSPFTHDDIIFLWGQFLVF